MWMYKGVLSTNADSKRRRAHDDVLQVCRVRDTVEGELALGTEIYSRCSAREA